MTQFWNAIGKTKVTKSSNSSPMHKSTPTSKRRRDHQSSKRKTPRCLSANTVDRSSSRTTFANKSSLSKLNCSLRLFIVRVISIFKKTEGRISSPRTVYQWCRIHRNLNTLSCECCMKLWSVRFVVVYLVNQSNVKTVMPFTAKNVRMFIKTRTWPSSPTLNLLA